MRRYFQNQKRKDCVGVGPIVLAAGSKLDTWLTVGMAGTSVAGQIGMLALEWPAALHILGNNLQMIFLITIIAFVVLTVIVVNVVHGIRSYELTEESDDEEFDDA